MTLSEQETDQAIEILSKTNDGDDLDPQDLSLVQGKVNQQLTAAGEQAFAELYNKVAQGNYTKPWLAGVEHVTRDQAGYVYWKAQIVEHFTFNLIDPQTLKSLVNKLAATCRHIEALEIPVCTFSCTTELFAKMPLNYTKEYKELLYHLPNCWEHSDGTTAFLLGGNRNAQGYPIKVVYLELCNGNITVKTLPVKPNNVEYHSMVAIGFQYAVFDTLDDVTAWFNKHGITPGKARELLNAREVYLKNK
jgi:hypothetical protein